MVLPLGNPELSFGNTIQGQNQKTAFEKISKFFSKRHMLAAVPLDSAMWTLKHTFS